MQEYEAALAEEGQVTIPVEIRRIMGLRPHDRVRFEVEGNIIRLRKASSNLLNGFGAVVSENEPESFQKLREAFEQGVAEEVVSED